MSINTFESTPSSLEAIAKKPLELIEANGGLVPALEKFGALTGRLIGLALQYLIVPIAVACYLAARVILQLVLEMDFPSLYNAIANRFAAQNPAISNQSLTDTDNS